MNERLNLLELVRDPSEIRDLLLAYGEEPSADEREARARLLEILRPVEEGRLIDTLFEFARGMAAIVHEVTVFCAEKGVRIQGQIQLKDGSALSTAAALQTSWAHGGKRLRSLDLDSRAHALAAELSGIARRLDPADLIRRQSERVLTDFGRDLRESPDPEHQVWLDADIAGAREDRRYDSVSETDLAALRSASGAVAEAQSSLGEIAVPGEISAALLEVEARIGRALAAMERARRSRSRETSPPVMSFCSELYLIAMQCRLLVEEATEGRRVEDGFRDFVRSEFWAQRWRIYELWLLVRVLRVLENSGATTTLEPVELGVWTLPYGRASTPVARCQFPSGRLEVFYQYWRQDGEGADMPDLLVAPVGARPLLVLNPKHGLTYQRSQLGGVLRRYARNFLADITAIVNFFGRPGHPFEDVRWDTRQWILAANVAPGTAELQRLELRIAEALLARGYRPAARVLAPGAAAGPKRSPARAAALVYWAQEKREVDEPEGLWALTERGGVRHLPELSAAIAAEGRTDVRAIEATRDGEACVIRLAQEMVLLAVDRPPRRLAVASGYRTEVGSWSSSGALYALDDGEVTRIFERSGEQSAEIPVPNPWGDTESWGIDRKCLGWSADGNQLIRVDGREERLFVHRSSADLKSWEEVGVFGESRRYPGDKNTWRLLRSAEAQTVLALGRYELFQIDAAGRLTPWQDPAWGAEVILSVSPSGAYRLEDGPTSVRRRDGVRLLQVVDQRPEGKPLPLVRFFGPPGAVAAWSPDESRYAFLVLPEPRGRGPTEHRLMVGRIGDRHATPVSLPGQRPEAFAWLAHSLVRVFT